MKAIEFRLPKEIDKSFTVFNEKGNYFPCPWHYHPEFELVLINKSTGKRMVGDHIGYYEEGDLVLMGPNIPHVWISDELEKNQNSPLADAIVIHFTSDFIGQNIFQIPEFSSLKNILDLSSRGIHIKGVDSLKIADVMNNMINESGLRRISSIFHVFDLLSISENYNLLASPNFLCNSNRESNRHSRINDYILRNFHNQITLKEVADEAYMCTTTFCNFFKKQYRMSFIDYLNQIRIGHFCKLITDKEKSILESAYASGFNSIANFNKQFKKIKGMSPSEFKKALSAKY